MNEKVFLGNKLRIARLFKGLTQQELGTAVSSSRQFIHQLESGSKHPTSEVMNAICEALEINHIFLSLPIVNEVKPEQCHFRKLRTTPVKLANRVMAFGTLFEQLAEFINTYLELPVSKFPDVPHDYNSYTNDEVERAAESSRKFWGLGTSAPISNMTRVLENAGVLVTQFEGVSEKVDALSINRKFPIVIRNTAKESPCRLRFDLAHELGHLVLHNGVETGDHTTEDEANKFASAFLFPRRSFVKEFNRPSGNRLNWSDIYSLKIRWGMSARAIIYRAHSLDLISAQQYRSANVYLNKSGQTKTENFDDEIVQEKPELLNKSIDTLNVHLSISFSDIAEELGIHTSLLSAITGYVPSSDQPKNIKSILLAHSRK